MTKKEMYNAIATVMSDSTMAEALAKVTDRVTAQELVDFANHEIELLSNRNSSRKPTKTQRENEILKEKIYEILVENDRPMRSGEVALILGVNIPKVTPQLGKLVSEGRAVNTKQGKNSYYSATKEVGDVEG